MTQRFVLVLDVDGPLNPYAATAEQRGDNYVTHRWKREIRTPTGSVYYRRLPRVWLDPRHGAALLGLPADLVWGTSWNRLANRYVGPAVGLPELPVIDVGDPPLADRPGGFHWKVPALAAYEPDRPMLWVDDECTPEDAVALTRLRHGPAKIHHVDPGVGLTDRDFAELRLLVARNLVP